ncbi:hypothetical protein EVC02_079 [Rhizobium phage RHph_N17]|nr:hypothetical protein EVC02_079 [Rhizobium phage RHph_N17]
MKIEPGWYIVKVRRGDSFELQVAERTRMFADAGEWWRVGIEFEVDDESIWPVARIDLETLTITELK